MKDRFGLKEFRMVLFASLGALAIVVGVHGSVVIAQADLDLSRACCFGDGRCEDLSYEACIEQGGTPQGDGSSCSMAKCPQPTQACCFDSGFCLDMAPGACADEGGIPQGEGTDCSPNPCPQPTQACCFEDGSCRDLTAEACDREGGRPQGEGSDCIPNRCPQPAQACCLEDGSCLDLTTTSCRVRGGVSQGIGSHCCTADCPQPTQACCLEDGSCQDLVAAACQAAGGTAQGTGTSCISTACPQPDTSPLPLRSIRLISPLPGEGLDPGSSQVQFCWETLGIPGLTYDLIHHTKQCDPDVTNGPHPFAPLLPDPTLAERRRASRLRKDQLSRQLANLADYCANLQRTFAQCEQRLGEIPGNLRRLKDGRDEADAAQVDTAEKPFELPLPTACPRSALELLAPHAGMLGAIRVDPCDPDACRDLSDRLWGIIDMIQSLQAHAVTQVGRFERLLRRWVDGADHRGVMQLYHDLFSLVDQAIGLVTDIIDLLTPDLEGMLRDLIQEHLTDAVCRRSPALCEAIDSAESAEEQLSTILEILAEAKATGTPGPAFLVQMVQAMAQQVSKATAAAVEGWATFAEVMGAVLWDAYEGLLCEQQALAWLLSQRARIEALCEACQECLRNDIADVDAELGEIAAQQQAAAAARVSYWQEQCAAISSQITQAGAALLTQWPDWYDRCCRSVPQTIEIPGETLCAQQLEEALKSILGDKACFLSFSCTLSCQYRDGVAEAATVECEHSFPLAERRTCCCVPCERQQTSLGSQPDPGRPAGPTCGVPEECVLPLPPGSWGVDARDESGNLVASSPRRELGRGAVSEPSHLRPEPTPLGGCLCSISASIDGIPMTPGGFALTMQQGALSNIAAVGDCGPNCDSGMQSISIQPPIVAPAWLASPLALLPPPVSVAAPSVGYDFPIEGTYTIVVKQFCEDSECTHTFTVNAVGSPSSVPRQPRAGETPMHGTCPACKSDDCIELAYRQSNTAPIVPLYGHTLKLTAPSELDLEVTSSCRPDCSGDRHVRWEMSEPNANVRILEGEELYQISYVFEQIGQYALCVIETIPCPEAELRFENWWMFDIREEPPSD